MNQTPADKPLLSPVSDTVVINRGAQVFLLDEPASKGKIVTKTQDASRPVRIREIVRLANGKPVACWGEKRSRKGVAVDERTAQQLGAVLRQAA